MHYLDIENLLEILLQTFGIRIPEDTLETYLTELDSWYVALNNKYSITEDEIPSPLHPEMSEMLKYRLYWIVLINLSKDVDDVYMKKYEIYKNEYENLYKGITRDKLLNDDEGSKANKGGFYTIPYNRS